MKKLRYYTLLLLAATLAGCSNELGTPQMNPDYLEPGTSAMQIAVGFPQPKGYAVGDDVAAGVATTEEKEIKSLAFFVKTSHAFAKFLSEEPLLSNNGFTNPLVEVSAGNYTASIKVRSTKFDGNSEVIAVANYKENGLDFSNVTTIKQLKELVTEALDGSANLKTPLLMYGQDGAVTLADQGTAAVDLEMTRMVARLDVKNAAIDPGNPTDDDFTLTSVRLLNAPSKSALLPDLRQSFTGIDLPVRTPGAGEAFLNYTYLYETLNDIPDNRPMIEVEGTYRGSKVVRQIPFKTKDEPGTPGVYFAIQRNFHYVLTIHPAEGTNDLMFDLAVKDWDEGKQISVKPSIKAPKLENFVWAGVAEAELSNQGITWDATNLKLMLTQKLTDDITLSFDASAYQAPKCVVAKAQDTDAELITVDGNIKMGDISGYAEGDPGTPEEPEIIDPDADAPMPLKRTIVFTLPKNVESLVTEGTTHTNLLNVQVTDKYATTITVVYKDGRTAPPTP